MKGIQPSVFMLLVVVASITSGGNYRVAAQTPALLCITSLITLSPCTGYVTSNSSTTPPSPSCCTALSSVVRSSVVCLCQLFISNNTLGISINKTRALALPKACNVSTPPLTRCQGITVDAPAPSPSSGGSGGADSPADSPTSESVPSPSPSITPSIPTTPTVVTPSNGSPSAIPPPVSNGSGINPKAKNDPTSNQGAHFLPSILISIFAMLIIASFVL